MKFLCPSCKAKYQIGDEKVAGRSVRMKCRKCGAEIRITSTEAVLTVPPPPAADLEPERHSQPQAMSERGSRPSQLGASRPINSRPSAVSRPSATASSVPPSDAVRPLGAGTRSAGTSAALKQSPPRPPSAIGAVKGVASRPINPRVSVRSDGAVPIEKGPRGASHAVKAQTIAASAAPASEDKLLKELASDAEYNDEEQTRISDAGILTGAFSAAVSSAATPISDPLTMPGDEWFVGINGVPVGPIRLSELRSKAATGAVNKESLVWRDGFEEWRPLKSFPELTAVVEESLSSAMASAQPLVLPDRGDQSSDPFGATVPKLNPGAATPAVMTGAAVVREDLEAAGLSPRRSFTEKAAWVAIAMALGLGVTLGSVFFNKKPEEIVRYVPVPQKGTEAPAPAAVEAKEQALPETPVPGQATPPKTSTKPAKPVAAAQPKPAESAKSGGLNLNGLSSGIAGPGGGDDPLKGASSNSPLDSAAVQKTVASYTPSVRRSCWQPALDTRDKDASASARVVVAIQVSASGKVLNASTATGDPKGYRGLANCIVGRVRGWQFPPSSGQTTVNVPFVFVAQ